MADPFKDRDTPWRDEDALEQLYVKEGLTQAEIGEKFGVSQRTISRMMEKHEIDTSPRAPDNRLRDAEKMEELYCEKMLTASTIADDFGCSPRCVIDWLERHSIETRGRLEEANRVRMEKPPRVRTEKRGYEVVENVFKGEKYYLRLHRLIYAAEHGTDAVDGKVVHHKNGIPWDNRPQNLEAMTAEEHGRHHNPIDFYRGDATPRDRHETT